MTRIHLDDLMACTPAAQFIRLVRARIGRLVVRVHADIPPTLEPLTLRDAVRSVCRDNPWLALRALEAVGSWPSSEPELRALQECYDPQSR